MSFKKNFNNFGLVRTENFKDINNRNIALSNLLNDLVSGDLTFDARDIQLLNGLSSTQLTQTDFRKISGATVEQSSLDGSSTETQVSQPFITLKNRLDTIEKTTGKNPFFNGGNGLPVKFWESDNINPLSSITDGDSVSNESPNYTKDIMWDIGYFEFSNIIDKTIGGNNGVLQWEGYFVPIESGQVEFVAYTSGYLLFELEDENGNLEIVKNVLQDDYTVTSLTDVVSGNTIEISKEDYSKIAQNSIFNNQSDITVQGVNHSQNTDKYTVVLSEDVTIGANETFTISVGHLIGSDENYSVRHTYRNLEKFTPRKIRITLLFPGDVSVLYDSKKLEINFSQNNNTLENLNFWYLYDEYPDVSNIKKGTFKDFSDTSLLEDGGVVGPDNVQTSDEYTTILTTSPLKVNYVPPKSYADILIGDYRYKKVNNNPSISVTSTSPYTGSIGIGNILLGDDIPYDSKVIDISENTLLISSQNSTGDSVGSVKVFDHLGFISYQAFTRDASVVTVNDTSNISPGILCLTEDTTDYCRVIEVISDTEFSVDNVNQLSTGGVVFFYHQRGLINNTLDNFCVGVIGKETFGGVGEVAAQGDTVIPINDVDEITSGMVVQSTGFVEEGTTVTSINTSSNEITLSNPLLKGVISGISIVFAPQGTTNNKEQCIIPLNTAPPFTGTDSGLATEKNIKLTHTNSTISVTSLTANSVTVNEVPINSKRYDKEISVTVDGSKFKIMGSSS